MDYSKIFVIRVHITDECTYSYENAIFVEAESVEEVFVTYNDGLRKYEETLRASQREYLRIQEAVIGGSMKGSDILLHRDWIEADPENRKAKSSVKIPSSGCVIELGNFNFEELDAWNVAPLEEYLKSELKKSKGENEKAP